MYPTTILHTTILLLFYIDYNIDYNIDYKSPICSGTSACSSSPYRSGYKIYYKIDYKSPICSGTSACSSSPCHDGICVPVSETERVCMCERNVTPDEQGSCGESPDM